MADAGDLRVCLFEPFFGEERILFLPVEVGIDLFSFRSEDRAQFCVGVFERLKAPNDLPND